MNRLVLVYVFIAALSNAALILSAAISLPELIVTAAEQKQILGQFSAHLQNVKSLQVKFVQNRHVHAFLDVLQSNGVMYYQAPDKLRWEVREPYESISILNGTKAAKFDLENGKVTKMTGMEDFLYEVLHQIAGIIQGNFEGIEKSFQIRVGKKTDHYIVHLRPLRGDVSKNISRMEILSDSRLQRVEHVRIFEPQGDRIEITFSQPTEGVNFQSRVFDLNDPVFPE
jgi:outer membrane lipoprotein-sorting protein